MGYIVEGLTVFAGAPKIGKSWLMLALAFAVAVGGLALGSIACEAGDVLYLALEDNLRRLQSRLRHMRLAEFAPRLTLMTKWPDLDGGCIREIEKWAASVLSARMVIIDVFAKVRGVTGGKENQYESDYRFAAMLQELATRLNLAIVIIHHTRKMDAEDPFDSVSGTRGLTGAADSVLVLKKDGATATPVIYGRGRDLEEIESALSFDAATAQFSVIGDAGTIAKTHEQQAILQLLGREGTPMSATEIGAILEKTRSNIQHQLARLYIDGKVSKHPKGLYTLVTPFTAVTQS
jgi:DNA-binding transcriptional ArsR family regulator